MHHLKKSEGMGPSDGDGNRDEATKDVDTWATVLEVEEEKESDITLSRVGREKPMLLLVLRIRLLCNNLRR